MTIFIHRASECLTDHLPHGEGLICFSLLNGLALRGHRIFAFTNHADIQRKSDNLIVKEGRNRLKMNSFTNIDLDWQANAWRKSVVDSTTIDIDWRMSPFDAGCPFFNVKDGCSSVIGPIYYSWPSSLSSGSRSRLGAFTPYVFIRYFSKNNWRASMARASLVIATTDQHSASLQAEHGCAQMLTLPLIVHAPELSTEPERSTEILRLAFVGRLDAQKNPQVFLETVAQVAKMGQSVQGVIVGDGPLRQELEARAATLGLTERLTFTGRIPNAQVYEVIASCHWLVSTSVGEPYGRNIAEAMSMGVPTICHASGGPKDFLRDGVDGLLVPELDAKSYAANLLACPNQPTLASNARQRALSEWSEAAVLDRLEAALLALVESK